ncbi:MAG: hypothetical protein QOF60_2016 [Actinomycetota bacterium]|jgi:hypothetical protein|nr:hypothetical protein [Actinomycetota bacterium]
MNRITDGWIWPHWLERQLDPRSAAFVPRADEAEPTNVTKRNWTVVGTVASTEKGIVDPRGLLTPWPGGWSLDWWIGADDRWHVPSREAAVRQTLVDDTPVVETVMRVPSGDAVHRVYAVPGDDGPLAIIEISNRSPTPFAVALAVRPYNPEGLSAVERIGLRDDTTVTVDGRPALLLPKRPQRMAASTFRDGDSASIVMSGAAGDSFPDDLRCDAGLAQAAFLFPLAHTATLRVAVPLDRSRRAPSVPEPLPASDAVVRGWKAQTDSRGLRLVLPEGRLASAVEANRRYLLLFHEGDDVVRGPFAYLLAALDRFGFAAESGEVVRHLGTRRSGAALWAMAEHWRLTGSLDDIDLEAVAKGVHSIERHRHAKRGRKDEGVYSDDFWSLRGLLDGAALLRAGGHDKLADEADRWAEGLRTDLFRSIAPVAKRLGVIASLVACWPLGLLDAGDPRMAATVDLIRERYCVGPAFFQGTGLGTYLTLQLAAVELLAGDARCLERLAWFLDSATPTYTWPAAIHPRLDGGCAGDGHDGWAAAEFLSFVRALLVREVGASGLALCSMLPAEWQGQNLEVHDAPTHHGLLSFAVRWHGDRPALLWDLRLREGAPPVTLTAPGLDPSWSTTEAKGETLLAARAIEGSFS